MVTFILCFIDTEILSSLILLLKEIVYFAFCYFNSKISFTGRTASTSTFDSLDMARYSDDGAVQTDEKVAGIGLISYSKNYTHQFNSVIHEYKHVFKVQLL